MGQQITASKTGLLLQCSRPFADDIELDEREEAGEPARWGSTVHETSHFELFGYTGSASIYTHALTKWGFQSTDYTRLVNHTNKVLTEVKRFLKGDNEFNEPFQLINGEIHSALKLFKDDQGDLDISARVTDFDEARHEYFLKKKEIGFTHDILVEGVKSKRQCVLDIKTGEHGDYTNPKTPQLLTLALGLGAELVGILHVPELAIPMTYVAEVTAEEAAAHARAILKARARIGDGSMRPGPECRYCPARGSCPTQVGDLLQKTGALVKRAYGGGALELENINKGAFLEASTQLENLIKYARSLIREEVRNGEVVERNDGKVYEIITYEKRNISLKSITEALGKEKGEKEIARLERMGCVTRSEEERMIPK